MAQRFNIATSSSGGQQFLRAKGVSRLSMLMTPYSAVVDLAEGTGLPLYRQTGYSLSIWLRRQIDGVGTMWADLNSVDLDTRFHFSMFGSRVQVQIKNDDGVQLMAKSSDVMLLTTDRTNWYQVVWTELNGQCAMYVNGKYTPPYGGGDWNYTFIGPMTVDQSWIGSPQSPSTLEQYFDEVAAFDRVLTPEEVSRLYNGGLPTDLTLDPVSPNLIGWWRMGEGAFWDGTNWTIPDASGNGHIGVSVNLPETALRTESPGY